MKLDEVRKFAAERGFIARAEPAARVLLETQCGSDEKLSMCYLCESFVDRESATTYDEIFDSFGCDVAESATIYAVIAEWERTRKLRDERYIRSLASEWEIDPSRAADFENAVCAHLAFAISDGESSPLGARAQKDRIDSLGRVCYVYGMCDNLWRRANDLALSASWAK